MKKSNKHDHVLLIGMASLFHFGVKIHRVYLKNNFHFTAQWEGCDSMETAWHVICECPATWKLRAEVFKTYQSLETPLEWSVYQINKIVSTPQVINILTGRLKQMGTH